jgi:hypothetical protein
VGEGFGTRAMKVPSQPVPSPRHQPLEVCVTPEFGPAMWAEIGSPVSRDTGSRGTEETGAPGEAQVFGAGQVEGGEKASKC